MRRLILRLTTQQNRQLLAPSRAPVPCRYFVRPSTAVKLSYDKYSSKSAGVPLFVTHGLLGSKENWQSLGKAIAKSGHTVYAVDSRNHGLSAHSDEMDFDTMALDFKQLADELGLEKVNFLGHSLGGKIAMSFALNFPERVSRLLVLDSLPVISVQRELLIRVLAALRTVQFDSAKNVAENRRDAVKFLQTAIPDEWLRLWLARNIVEMDGDVKWKCNLPALQKNIHAIMDYPDYRTQFVGPSLFLGGSKSDYFKRPDLEDVIYELFPNADIEVIEGAGHWVHSDKPKEFLAATLRFLN